MIPVNEPLLNGNEKKYLAECIDSGWISSEGPFVSRFEAELGRITGRRHAVAVCNGSLALDAAIVALGIGPGDEVIIPAFTIISCAAAVVRVGATPVLVDCDPHTWNMDVNKIAERIGPRTKAIMAVHIYGLPVEMDEVLRLARIHNLKVIEDAAEMHGQTYRNRPCGSMGDISVFSFYPNKHITTGEGGMILTNDDELARRCRSLRNLYFEPPRRFVHKELGWNLRMSNLQAALGCAQLERLENFVRRKREMGARYTALLSGLRGVQLPVSRTRDAENIYWVYGIVLDDDMAFDAEEAMHLLSLKGVQCRPFFWPMHEQPVFKKMGLFVGESYPVAERIARRGFYIPSGLALSEEQIGNVANALREICQ